MQKKLVQSSLALTAAAALGLGSAFVASPAVADNGPQKLDVQSDAKVKKALSEVEGVNAYGAKDGQLNIGVATKTEEIKDLEKKYKNVNVTEGIKQLEPRAKNDLVGGNGYLVSAGGQVAGACSTGFSGWDGDGNPVVLTAGHCAKVINEQTGEFDGDTAVDQTELPSSSNAGGGEGFKPSGLGIIGQWDYNKFGGELVTSEDQQPADDDIDFAVINVDETKYKVKTGATDWTTAADDDLAKSLATDITKVGAHTDGTVQKSGRTTGLTEDEVWTDLNEQYTFMNIGGRFVHGFGVKAEKGDPFSASGDSGGGVFQGDTAVGVISGGGDVTQGGVTYDMSWVADLDYSLDIAGMNDFTFEAPGEEPPGDDDANADAAAEGDDANADDAADGNEAEADADAAAEGDNADADAAAEGDDTNADDAADGNEAEADADAAAEGDDANADAADDAKEAEADAAAEGDDANADDSADGKDAEADAAADGKDDDADGSDDGDEPTVPDAPKVGDQTVDEGGNITGKAAPNADVKLTWKAAGDAQAGSAKAQADVPAEGSVTVKADAEGNFKAEAPAEAGEYAYTATATVDGETSGATSFVVTVEASDDAPAERKLTVDPKEVTASDFVKKDKGVQIKAEGFEEGEKVTLKVTSGPENVEGITLDETANEDGVAGFSIYGTSAADPSAYLGKYDVQVTGANDTADEEALNGSFEVVSDEDGNGGGGNDGDDDGNNGDDDGNGDGGSDLPRTGAELTGLAAGAGLLLVGGAAVVLTLRRNKQN
ncbi:S1 family peptidase [Brevibacterium aurantiacum]|uniref:LPXTG cell wall anchor domain-containing protein n=1 Tax=Brevibacterium aurantiacum TaxID=273384 RepID=A0A4Z0KJS9_BREAU|nr:S1 family peptidase [Brevibacterium aurantiacum]TGD39087.1 LPXTG cell wall anchor domain-containing protein [Brevibacterium aurantiacum]